VSKRDVAALLLETGAVAVRTDPEKWFTWTSARRAPIYCDNRVLVSFPSARARVADFLTDEIRNGFSDVEVIAGAATGGIPHAAWVAERMELPMVYVRGVAKEHGTGKRVEGRQLAGERVVLIEDLVSFGGSALSAAGALEEEGGKVIGVQAIFSYGFRETLESFDSAGIPLQVLTDYDARIETMELDATTARALLDWRAG
jgi:orotate phosphoribosyltransferase